MNLALIVILLLICGGVVAWLMARQREMRTPTVEHGDRAGGRAPWQRHADVLSDVKPSQAQVGESVEQRSAPRTEDT